MNIFCKLFVDVGFFVWVCRFVYDYIVFRERKDGGVRGLLLGKDIIVCLYYRIIVLWLFYKKKKVLNFREIMVFFCNVLCMVLLILSKVNIIFMEFIVECCEFIKIYFYL